MKKPDLRKFMQAMVMYEKGHNQTEIQNATGIPRSTIQNYINRRYIFEALCWEEGVALDMHEMSLLVDIVEADDKPDIANAAGSLLLHSLKDEVRSLKAQIKGVTKEQLDTRYIRQKIFHLSEETIDPPDWLISNNTTHKSPGVPTLFASDWHWGENVDSSQIGGVNSFDLEIAHKRARTLITTAIDLLNNHMVNPDYPGIVFVLGGDMVSGDIHEELMATNEIEIMPTVIDLVGVLTWCIRTLADTFGRVFVPCVTGNHGRNTHKIRAKGRNFTSFDWLLYTFLDKVFHPVDPETGEHLPGYDDRVQFAIPNGPDCLYSIYGHKYLLTHGDQFRGGDGVIGALGPIIRGDHRKRSRNGQIAMQYDTMIIGHWHQYISLERLIVNGSLKGYDEYAYSNNFGFEPPRQALWLTHPRHGITFRIPVLLERKLATESSDKWLEWKN